MRRFTVVGRYETKAEARMAKNRFEDQPGAYHRVRYTSDERYPDEPWTILVFDWQHEADFYDENGEVNSAVRDEC